MAALYDSSATIIPTDRPGEDTVTINFVEDGLSAFGKVWVRGEELSVKRGTPSWEATCDRNGNSWMELTDREQYARWGEVRFREGEWAGRALTEIEDPAITDADRALLAKAEAEKAEALNKAQEAAERPARARKRSTTKKAAAVAPEPVLEPVEVLTEVPAEQTARDDDFLEQLNSD